MCLHSPGGGDDTSSCASWFALDAVVCASMASTCGVRRSAPHARNARRPPARIHTCFWSSSFGMWFPAPPRPMRTYVVIGRVFSLVVFFFSFFFCTAGGHRFVGWIGGRVGMRDSCRRRTEGWLVMCI